MIHSWSIARRLFVANLLLVLAFAAIAGTATFVDARDHSFREAERRTTGVAAAVAANPLVLQAAGSENPSELLQPYALKVMASADADFVTIMAPDRTRWTHPREEELGRPYIGTIDAALAGGTLTEITTGTLGPSVRSVAPVTDADGTVRALVAAGITVRELDVALSARLPALLATVLLLLLGGSAAAWLLGRYLKRVTRGWGPEQLAQLFAYYESVLHSVREGLILVDTRGQVVMYNNQAAQLLGLPPHHPGEKSAAPQPLADLPLPASLKELFESGRPARDEIHLTGSRIVVVNQSPAVAAAAEGGRRPAAYGSVATLRDRTEIEALGSELETMRTLSDALRAQTHEHANRLHTMVSLLELGRTREALEFATRDLELSQQLTDEILGSIDEPVLSALIVGKASEANERGVKLSLTTQGPAPVAGLAMQDLVTILGNLLDNAIDSAAEGPLPRQVDLMVESDDEGLDLGVHDSGPPIDPGEVDNILKHGYSTKSGATGTGGRGIGLALVRQAVQRLGGTMTINGATGSKFHVFLPAQSDGPARQQQQQENHHG